MGKIKNRIKAILKKLPKNFTKHYIYPKLYHRVHEPYNARNYFESYYDVQEEFNDGVTIGPGYNNLFTKFHYNSVENSIISFFVKRNFTEAPKVLDIGSGAGHWIDFYLDTFKASKVTGIDLSEPCVNKLKEKYKPVNNVKIALEDITSINLKRDEKYDIINAIGVIFHIVDDKLWEQTLTNLASMLNPNGYIVVGGHFGIVTQNVQFHFKNEKFETFDEILTKRENVSYVNKRIRSLSRWKKVAKRNNLQVLKKIATRSNKNIVTPENNILILTLIGH